MYFVALEPLVQVESLGIHLKFDHAPAIAVASHGGIGPLAHGQTQRTDHQALTTPGLTGDDGEALG